MPLLHWMGSFGYAPHILVSEESPDRLLPGRLGQHMISLPCLLRRPVTHEFFIHQQDRPREFWHDTQ